MENIPGVEECFVPDRGRGGVSETLAGVRGGGRRGAYLINRSFGGESVCAGEWGVFGVFLGFCGVLWVFSLLAGLEERGRIWGGFLGVKKGGSGNSGGGKSGIFGISGKSGKIGIFGVFPGFLGNWEKSGGGEMFFGKIFAWRMEFNLCSEIFIDLS